MKLVTHLALVGVGSLRVNSSVFLDVGEGLVHQTTVAALVALRSGAVHQVLLAQGHQLARLPKVLTLQRAGGAEGPAGAALSLKETHTEMFRRFGFLQLASLLLNLDRFLQRVYSSSSYSTTTTLEWVAGEGRCVCRRDKKKKKKICLERLLSELRVASKTLTVGVKVPSTISVLTRFVRRRSAFHHCCS